MKKQNSDSRRDFLKKASALSASLAGLNGLPLSALAQSQVNALTPPNDLSPQLPQEAQEIEMAYLKSIYARTQVEIDTAFELKIHGSIPLDLEGTFIRNGPNPQFNNYERHHWFDGDGMLHKIRIHQGKAFYQNKYILTEGLKKERSQNAKIFCGLRETLKLGHYNVGKFLESQSSSLALLSKFFKKTYNEYHGHEVLKDTSNTDVIYFNGKLITLWWLSGKPYILDPKSLNTLEVENFNNTFHGNMSAHARIDSRTNELFFLDFNQSLISPYVSAHKINSNGNKEWSKKFNLPYARIFHDLIFTENYVIVPNFPLGYLKDPQTKQVSPQLDHSMPTEMIVLSRKTGEHIKTFYMEPTYVLHFMNAFEKENEIICTATKFIDPIASSDLKNKSTNPLVGDLNVKTQIENWSLNLTTGLVSTRILSQLNTEFPRINEDYLGKNYEWAYSPLLSESREVEFKGFMKLNQRTGSNDHLFYGENLVGEEVIFMNKMNSQSEDDGYLGTFVHNKQNLKNDFRIYDALTLNWVCTLEIPFQVPFGFHGQWIKSTD